MVVAVGGGACGGDGVMVRHTVVCCTLVNSLLTCGMSETHVQDRRTDGQTDKSTGGSHLGRLCTCAAGRGPGTAAPHARAWQAGP